MIYSRDPNPSLPLTAGIWELVVDSLYGILLSIGLVVYPLGDVWFLLKALYRKAYLPFSSFYFGFVAFKCFMKDIGDLHTKDCAYLMRFRLQDEGQSLSGYLEWFLGECLKGK